MKVKTSELIGAALDWAVAKIEGHIDAGRVVIYSYRTYDEYGSPLGFNPPLDVYYSNDYRPSTRGDHAHPIIERERITLRVSTMPGIDWAAFYDVPGEYHAHIRQKGPTALIAATRCFVNKYLGDEVDIPEELLK